MSEELRWEVLRWAVAFSFTQMVEVPLYLRVTASFRVAFLASCFTHPIVWFVIPRLVPMEWNYWTMVAVCEAFAVLAEAAWLQWNRVPRALLWAFVVNGVSASAGLLLRELFGVP